MCRVFRDLKLAEYCPSPAHLAALSNEIKAELREKLSASLWDKEREEVSEGVLYLLFLVTPLPETTLATPNELMEWVGLAVLNDDDPSEFVLGKLSNRKASEQKRKTRESDYAESVEGKSSILSQLEELADLNSLTRKERQYVIDSAQSNSREELARRWRLSLAGVSQRLARLRKKIERLKNNLY